MKTYIALLKGINVGGHKKVPMAELRSVLEKIGLESIQTYIQSGNVIFKSSEKAKTLEEIIQKAIMSHFGFEVSILVITRINLKSIFDASPFSEEKKQASYFMMLHNTPDDALVKVASQKVYEGEEYKIINNCIYYYSAKGFGQAKFNVNYFERNLKTFATARNYNTMVKLLSLSDEN